jgi:hypothetical protein
MWRNTSSVLKWFSGLFNKPVLSFITFDVVEFYPSITADLMNTAFDYASNFIDISNVDRELIHHAKKSVLVSNNETWSKKSSQSFDVTMGSFDDTETCELIGLFLLNKIKDKVQGCFGLYRDDGLGAIRATPRQVENIKKSLCALFKEHSLRITVESNQVITNFLDVTLGLATGLHALYMEPNNKLLYVNSNLNHPPQITRI